MVGTTVSCFWEIYLKRSRLFLLIVAFLFLFIPSQAYGLADDIRTAKIESVLKQTEAVFADSTLSMDDLRTKTDSLLATPLGSIDPKFVCNLVSEVGEKLFEAKKYGEVIQYATSTKRVLRQLLPEGAEEESLLIKVSQPLIRSYAYLNLMEQSANLSYEALNRARKYNLETEMATINNYLGYINYNKRQYNKADSFYREAIVLNERLKDKRKLFINYSNISSSLGMQNVYNKAIEYAYLGIHQLDPETDMETVMICMRNIAGIYYVNKEYSVALKTLREVKDYQTAENQHRNLIDTYRMMAMVFEQEHQVDSALLYMEKGVKLAQQLGNSASQVVLLKGLASIYKASGRYERAFEHLSSSMALDDSLTHAANQERMANIVQLCSTEYQQHNEDLLLLHDIDKRNNRILAFAYGVVLLLVGCIFFLLYKLNKKNKEFSKQLVRELEVKEELIKDGEKEIYEFKNREKEYLEEIEAKEKEFSSLSLHMMRHEDFVNTIQEELKGILSEINPRKTEQREKLQKVSSLLRQQSQSGVLDGLEYYLKNINASFYENLTNAFPTLTVRDLRLCAMLKAGMSTKEIADITFREIRSVESARNRIRKKCSISKDENLMKFFSQY